MQYKERRNGEAQVLQSTYSATNITHCETDKPVQYKTRNTIKSEI